jgi:NTP pyrophosphatase (non-canonical NTP hydrolase)
MMTIEEAQKLVDGWIKTVGVRYFNELTNMAMLTEEVGEVARIIARKYGEQSFKDSDKEKQLDDELADVLWVLICLANQTGVDLTAAFERNLEKRIFAMVRDIKIILNWAEEWHGFWFVFAKSNRHESTTFTHSHFSFCLFHALHQSFTIKGLTTYPPILQISMLIFTCTGTLLRKNHTSKSWKFIWWKRESWTKVP